jgi:hypothetical protein
MKDLLRTYLEFRSARFSELGRERDAKAIGKQYYCGRPLPDEKVSNGILREKLLLGAPLFVTRLGGVEERGIVSRTLNQKGLLNSIPENVLKALTENAGFYYRSVEDIDHFSQLYIEGLKQASFLACSGMKGERFLIKNFYLKKPLLAWKGLNPILFEHPFTEALAGKKILVVSPFVETMSEQLKRQTLLFKNQNTLPSATYLFVKSPVTFAGAKLPDCSWFETLNSTFEKIKVLDFDVALLGCGSYGLPLAHRIFLMGRTAIHIGGPLQLLFGIRGNYYDNVPEIKELVNSAWVRPSVSEKPSGFQSVEGGCYW